jgi:hypothetical protein
MLRLRIGAVIFATQEFAGGSDEGPGDELLIVRRPFLAAVVTGLAAKIAALQF